MLRFFSSFRSRRLLGFSAIAVLATVVVAWFVGLARFVSADGSFEARLPRRLAPPSEEHNLAALPYGPLVRASSFNRSPVAYHHPWFLVDGRDQPTLIEKWSSAGKDRAPWVEIHWREPRQLSRVVLRHAGGLEGDHVTMRDYTLICLRGREGPGEPLVVRGNTARIATHALPCAGALGVRLEARLQPWDVVRLYELEAFGR